MASEGWIHHRARGSARVRAKALLHTAGAGQQHLVADDQKTSEFRAGVTTKKGPEGHAFRPWEAVDATRLVLAEHRPAGDFDFDLAGDEPRFGNADRPLDLLGHDLGEGDRPLLGHGLVDDVRDLALDVL